MLKIPRQDDPKEVLKHKDKFLGATALLVLGGPSGIRWKKLRDEIKPDVIITCNGLTNISGATYWVLGENMNRALFYALKKSVERDRIFLKELGPNKARWRFINWQNWHTETDLNVGDYFDLYQPDIVKFNRFGFDYGPPPSSFTMRDYSDGLLSGWIFQKGRELRCKSRWRVGTVAIHMLHLAGLVGCSELHTIGLDLSFPNGRKAPHHWFKWPMYTKDNFRSEQIFTTYEGVLDTQWDWIEGAEFINTLEPLFKRDKILWQDHSNGLLQKMNVWCAL